MDMLKSTCFFAAAGLLAGCGSVFKQEFSSTGVVLESQPAAAVQVQESFVFEAELGTVVERGTDTWEVVDLDEASAGKIARETGGNFFEQAELGSGLVWSTTFDSDNSYDIWSRVRPNPTGDSLFFDWGGESLAHHWPAEAHDQWVWTRMRSVAIEAGKNYSFAIWARESSIEIDLIVIQTAGALEPDLAN